MAPSSSSTVPIGTSLVEPALLKHRNSEPQASSWKALAEIEDNRMLVYETETQQLRQINRRELQASYKGIARLLPSTKQPCADGYCLEINAKEPTFLQILILLEWDVLASSCLRMESAGSA